MSGKYRFYADINQGLITLSDAEGREMGLYTRRQLDHVRDYVAGCVTDGKDAFWIEGPEGSVRVSLLIPKGRCEDLLKFLTEVTVAADGSSRIIEREY
ncbi:MAG: hypothetical protein KKG75_04630 [Nanoarchaeota archaeon]|nr:hypothetical protein [Nanoarchaeota archaeon]